MTLQFEFSRSSAVTKIFCRAALFVLAVAAGVPADARPVNAIAARFETGSGKIELVRAKGVPDQVVVSGLTEAELQEFKSLTTRQQRQAMFTVSVARTGTEATPMLGKYQVVKAAVVFEPRFPLNEGVTYIAKWRGKKSIERSFELKLRNTSPPRLTEVYPTANVLPENQLKFYLHFSKPMQQGEAYKHIRLVERDSGKEVTTPFLELGEELWDPTGTRFTLYFDPGRIKRGLQPRKLFGPTLESGKEYSLEVSGEWKDAVAGKPLGKKHSKVFKATEPDHTMPNHRKWKINAPTAGSKDPLSIDLDEPLDHAMLNRVLRLNDPKGNPIAGTIAVPRGETKWVFHPAKPWSAGIHTLSIDTALEDRAGNSIGRPFEVDMIEETTRNIPEESANVRFRIK